ncbi:hypothetical protein CC2G_012484 [Coprinopsis cinerea AmutBmut pab1-1]|nr:hypothetical protein CC2G_012484 [Coprinopsis cinerea AmutBmut pab1-1]
MTDTAATVDYTVVHPMPGHGKPLDYTPKKGEDPLYIGDPFPSALSPGDIDEGGRAILPLTTLREFSMLQFMNAITDKEDWHIKVLDDEIANKWKTEAVEAARAALRKQWEVERGPPVPTSSVGDDADTGDNEGGEPVQDDGDNDQEDEESDDGNGNGNNNANLDAWPIYTVRREESAMTPAMANFCIEELRHKARSFQNSPNGAIVVYNGNVVKSDTAVPAEVKAALQKAVEPLENVPAQHKDWHPGSDQQVLDLVHPSLFPLVYGKSRVLPAGAKVTSLEAGDAVKRCGEGEVLPVLPQPPEERRHHWGWGQQNQRSRFSDKFQWLPCEVDVSGDRAKILSYINNLHPELHQDLYRVVEDVITAAIPLWDLTLAPLADRDYQYPQRIVYDEIIHDPDPEEIPDDEGGPGPTGEEDEDDEDWWDLRQEWIEKFRRVVLPDVENPFDPETFGKTPAPFSLKDIGKGGRPLQVIVKLANIELTPEKPRYPGGTWHVEGQLNEHIVSTALYYYSSSNISSSSLAFRQLSDPEPANEMPYPQSVHDWLTDVYGCANEEGAVQDVGSVLTREGRLLTFPNILQHQVQPFELEDKTKPGVRKILALFLVDPHVRVVSTAHVPVQRMDWWRGELEGGHVSSSSSAHSSSSARLGQGGSAAVLKKLPVELQDHVYEEVDGFPISLAEAKKLREELMEERKAFTVDHGKLFGSGVTFSLCEH